MNISFLALTQHATRPATLRVGKPLQFQGDSNHPLGNGDSINLQSLQANRQSFRDQVDAAEKAEFKKGILGRDLGRTLLTVGPRDFTAMEFLKVVQELEANYKKTYRESYYSPETFFKELYPENARTDDKRRVFLEAMRFLQNQGFLDLYYDSRKHITMEDSIHLSPLAQRVLKEVSQAEVSQAYSDRKTVRQQEAEAQRLAEVAKQQEQEARTQAYHKSREMEGAKKNRVLLYRHESGYTGWEMLQRYHQLTEKRIWYKFFTKQGPVKADTFADTFPVAKQAQVRKQLEELKKLGWFSESYYSDALTLKLEDKALKRINEADPVPVLEIAAKDLRQCIELDIQMIEESITERQTQLGQADLEYQQAKNRMETAQQTFEKTRDEALALYTQAQKTPDLTQKHTLEMESAQKVQRAETLKLSYDAEQQGEATIKEFLQDVKARYALWYEDMQQHIQRRRQLIFQMNTAAIVNNMASLLKELNQIEQAEEATQQGLQTSLSSIFGQMNAQKATLSGEKVSVAAQQAMMKVDLASRIQALSATNVSSAPPAVESGAETAFREALNQAANGSESNGGDQTKLKAHSGGS